MTQYIRGMRAVLCTALVAVVAVAAGAQTVTGSIRGLVTDPGGAVVPGSEITATNVNTGVKTKTTTDKSGNYNIQTLSVGSYTVTATRQGFKTTSVGPIALEIDQIARIDVKLQVGEVSATVEVASESGAILQTDNASLGTTITSNTLESMPLPGQNFSAATVFVPGAVLPTYASLGSTQGTERDTSFAQSTQPSFNGNRMQTNNYIFDGTDINEPLQNTIAYNPAAAAIGQMRIITGNAEAEYGNVNGGEILVVTKGGTNKFHGSLYAFYENQDGTANTWSNDYTKLPRASSTRACLVRRSAVPSSGTSCSSSWTTKASAKPLREPA
jgi:Carboxypeptidase regulatory-like domain